MMLSNLVGQIVDGPVYKINKVVTSTEVKMCAKGCGRPRFLLKSGRYQSYCRVCNIEIGKQRYRAIQLKKKEAGI